MFDDALNSLYSEVAESISGPQSDRVTQQDLMALAQLIQQIPQQIPVADPTMALNGLIGQMASLAQQFRSINMRLDALEAKEPNFKPVIDEMRKTKTKTVVFDVKTDQYGFPEKVIAKEKVQR